MEIYELSHKEFRIILLRKFSEWQENIYRQLSKIRKTINEQSEKFDDKIATIKKQIQRLKNTITELKNSTGSFKTKHNHEEKLISTLEHRNLPKGATRKKNEKEWRKPMGIMGCNTKNNICLVGIPEGEEEEERTESIFKAIMAENCPNVGKKLNI